MKWRFFANPVESREDPDSLARGCFSIETVTLVTSSSLIASPCVPVRGKIVDMKLGVLSLVLRLDCLSCVLTIFSTILVGRRCWEGWVLAAVNSLIICVIGLRTAQLGFIPANLFCIVLYGVNLRTWRKTEVLPSALSGCRSPAQESR